MPVYPLILDFLNDLWNTNENSVGTRKIRLAAFKSFFSHLEQPGVLPVPRVCPADARDSVWVHH